MKMAKAEMKLKVEVDTKAAKEWIADIIEKFGGPFRIHGCGGLEGQTDVKLDENGLSASCVCCGKSLRCERIEDES